tara:strand:- start:83 stop:661 length:579 start_codon:yes stop_codon:yes gene_type:complete
MNELQKINNKLGGFNLSDLFTYDPDTGIIRHNPDRPKESFRTEKGYKMWLDRFCGKVAGSSDGQGYKKVGIARGGKTMNIHCHRLALYLSGVEIAKGLHVDHIDGDGSNNELSNLRVVTCQENMRNAKLSYGNKSGAVGVCWNYNAGKWRSAIRIDYKTIHLGYYTNKDDAIEARKAAEVKYGFHENHGRSS